MLWDMKMNDLIIYDFVITIEDGLYYLRRFLSNTGTDVGLVYNRGRATIEEARRLLQELKPQDLKLISSNETMELWQGKLIEH